jgi:HAD superfamily hydrolase (TIGR01509 family)
MFTVLWDNDGVLVDTEGFYFQATRSVLAAVGIELTLDQFQEISLRRGESTFRLAEERGVGAEDIADLRTERDRLYANALATQCCVIDGVDAVLRSLHGKVRMGVVTSSRRKHFEIVHATSGLLPYFDFVLAREDYKHSKPHPEPYLTALRRYHLRPEQCIVVEDSERGLAAANAAGLECLVVLSEWTQGGDFSLACQVFDDISRVPDDVLRRASR